MSINIKSILKSSFFSILVTMVIIFILALLSYFTGIGEGVVSALVYAAVAAGALLGTIAVSKAAGSKVFIHSMLVCVIYLAVLVGVSVLINRGVSFNSHFFTMTAGVFCAGFLGCVIGK